MKSVKERVSSLQNGVKAGVTAASLVDDPQTNWGWLECNGERERVVGRSIELVGPEILVGRKEMCQVRYANDSSVSSQHCCLYIAEDDNGGGGVQAWVEDLSVNGTFVNGIRVGKGRKLELQNLDEVSLLKPSGPSGDGPPPYVFLLHLEPSVFGAVGGHGAIATSDPQHAGSEVESFYVGAPMPPPPPRVEDAMGRQADADDRRPSRGHYQPEQEAPSEVSSFHLPLRPAVPPTRAPPSRTPRSVAEEEDEGESYFSEEAEEEGSEVSRSSHNSRPSRGRGGGGKYEASSVCSESQAESESQASVPRFGTAGGNGKVDGKRVFAIPPSSAGGSEYNEEEYDDDDESQAESEPSVKGGKRGGKGPPPARHGRAREPPPPESAVSAYLPDPGSSPAKAHDTFEKKSNVMHVQAHPNAGRSDRTATTLRMDRDDGRDQYGNRKPGGLSAISEANSGSGAADPLNVDDAIAAEYDKDFGAYLRNLERNEWDGQVVTVDAMRRAIMQAVAEERKVGQARTTLLVKEALEKAEKDADEVRHEAVRQAAEAVAAHCSGQADTERGTFEEQKQRAIAEAERKLRNEELVKTQEACAALEREHEAALDAAKARFDKQLQHAIESTRHECTTAYAQSEIGIAMVEESIKDALRKAEVEAKERAAEVQKQADAATDQAVAEAIKKTIAEEAVKTKSAIARAVAEAELRFIETADREQTEAVRAAEARTLEATRKQCVAEFEEKMAHMKEELSSQARKARLREQMLEAVMTDETVKGSAAL